MYMIIKNHLKAGKLDVRYMNIIADSDSDVYARIQDEVPVGRSYIKRTGCDNHVCK